MKKNKLAEKSSQKIEPVFTVYAIKKYFDANNQFIRDNFEQYTLAVLVNILLTKDKGYHIRIHPDDNYIVFGDLDNFGDTIMKFINDFITFLKNRYDIIIEITDVKYTNNKNKAGSYHYSIPKFFCSACKLKEIHNDFKNEYASEIYVYAVTLGTKHCVDLSIYGEHWFRFPLQSKESKENTLHTIVYGDMQDFIVDYIPENSINIENKPYIGERIVINKIVKATIGKRIAGQKNANTKKIINKQIKKYVCDNADIDKKIKLSANYKAYKIYKELFDSCYSAQRYNEYEDWMFIGMALRNIYDMDAFPLFDYLSAKADNYEGTAKTKYKYCSFHHAMEKGKGIGTLYEFARQDNFDEFKQILKNNGETYLEHIQNIQLCNITPKTLELRALNDKEKEIWKTILPTNNIIKKSDNGDTIWLHINAVCMVCDKMHDQVNNDHCCKIRVSTNLYHIINIMFYCTETKSNKVFYLTRENIMELKSYNVEDLNKYLQVFTIENLHKLIVFYQFNGKFEINIQLDNELSKHFYESIKVDFLKMENPDIGQHFDDPNVRTLCIKSYEGRNKTGLMIDYIKNYVVPTKSRIIITTPNVSTLLSILSRIQKAGGKPKSNDKNDIVDIETDEQIQFEYSWYKDTSFEDLRNGNYKVLLITINSLYKLFNKGSNQPIKFLKDTILWNDETFHTMTFIKSQTLENCRFESYTTLMLLIQFSRKAFFTCADMNNDIVDTITKLRPNNRIILFNEYTAYTRNYNITNSIKTFYDLLDQAIRNNEKVYIPTDSKNVSIAIEQILHKEHPNMKILLINSDTMNKSEIILNINTVVKNYDVFIYSPTISIGVSVEANVEDDGLKIEAAYFTRAFAYFKGKSVNVKGAQQLLQRVRNFTEKDHYIFFDQIVRTNLNMLDAEFDATLFKEILENKNKLVEKYHIDYRYTMNSDGILIPTSNNFTTDCYLIDNKIKICAGIDFKYYLCKEIIRRGNKVFTDIIDITKDSRPANNKIKKDMKKINVDYNLKNMEDIFNSNPIDHIEYEELAKKQKLIDLSKEEKDKVNRFFLEIKYNLTVTADNVDMLAKFFVANGRDLERQLQNFYFLFNPENIITGDNIQILEIEYMSKFNWILKILKKLGFSSLFDTKKIGSVDVKDFSLTAVELKELKSAFCGMNDLTRFRSQEPNSHAYINFISRILHYMFGVKIKNKMGRNNDKTKTCFYDYSLEYENYMMDYLVFSHEQYQYSELFEIFKQFFSNKCFIYKQLHGHSTTYFDYFNNYMFVVNHAEE